MANYVEYDYWTQGYGEGDLASLIDMLLLVTGMMDTPSMRAIQPHLLVRLRLLRLR